METIFKKYKPANFRDLVIEWLLSTEVNQRKIASELGMTPNKVIDLKRNISWTTKDEAVLFWWFCFTLQGPTFKKPPITIER